MLRVVGVSWPVHHGCLHSTVQQCLKNLPSAATLFVWKITSDLASWLIINTAMQTEMCLWFSSLPTGKCQDKSQTRQ